MSVVELSNLSLGVLSLASTLCLEHFIFLLFCFFGFCFPSRKKAKTKNKKQNKNKRQEICINTGLMNVHFQPKEDRLYKSIVQWPIHHKFLKAHGSELKLVFRRPQVQLPQGAFFIYPILHESSIIESPHSHYAVLTMVFLFLLPSRFSSTVRPLS